MGHNCAARSPSKAENRASPRDELVKTGQGKIGLIGENGQRRLAVTCSYGGLCVSMCVKLAYERVYAAARARHGPRARTNNKLG